jgi:hypothetical protein
MAHYGDAFVPLADEGASRVYGCRQPVAPEDLVDLQALPYREKLRLSDVAYASCTPPLGYTVAVAKGWLIFEDEGLETALAYLDTLPARGIVQPWVSDTPYVVQVAQAMRALATAEGKAHYHATYFG